MKKARDYPVVSTSEAPRPPIAHYKLSRTRFSPKFRPATSTAKGLITSKSEKSKLFEGLDDSQKGDFSPRQSVKRLILTPKSAKMVKVCLDIEKVKTCMKSIYFLC